MECVLDKDSIGKKVYFREGRAVYSAILTGVEFIRKPIYTAATKWLFPGKDFRFKLADNYGVACEADEIYLAPEHCAYIGDIHYREPKVFTMLQDIGVGEGRIACDADMRCAGYGQVEVWNKATDTATIKLARYKWDGTQVVKGFVADIVKWFIDQKGYGIEVKYKIPVEKKFLWFRWRGTATKHATLFKGDKLPVEGWDEMYLTEEECREANRINVVD